MFTLPGCPVCHPRKGAGHVGTFTPSLLMLNGTEPGWQLLSVRSSVPGPDLQVGTNGPVLDATAIRPDWMGDIVAER